MSDSTATDAEQLWARHQDQAVQHFLVFGVREGLRSGLSQYFSRSPIPSKYAGQARVAAIVARQFEGKLRVYDPQNLLLEHKEILRKMFVDSDGGDPRYQPIKTDLRTDRTTTQYDHIIHRSELELPGLISWAAQGHGVQYVSFFVNKPSNRICTEPIKSWLAGACWLLIQDLLFNKSPRFPNASQISMEHFALHAIEDRIRSKLNERQVYVDVRKFLEAIAEISVRTEEGVRPSGKLVWIRDDDIPPNCFAQFRDPRPRLSNHKHICKLLNTLDRDSVLLCSQDEALGVHSDEAGQRLLSVSFDSGAATVEYQGEDYCLVLNGAFYASGSFDLDSLTRALTGLGIECDTTSCEIIENTLELVRRQRHGCTLVFQAATHSRPLSGENYQKPVPIKDSARWLPGLCTMDGAVFISPDLCIDAAGVLLDARNDERKDHSRGSRYNSALAYSSAHSDVVIVVVSSDGGVSLFTKGQDLFLHESFPEPTQVDLEPPSLEDWLNL